MMYIIENLKAQLQDTRKSLVESQEMALDGQEDLTNLKWRYERDVNLVRLQIGQSEENIKALSSQEKQLTKAIQVLEAQLTRESNEDSSQEVST
jgi:NACalpha-BTF3-like transcription factor